MWSHRREGVSWTRFRSMQDRRYRTVSSWLNCTGMVSRTLAVAGGILLDQGQALVVRQPRSGSPAGRPAGAARSGQAGTRLGGGADDDLVERRMLGPSPDRHRRSAVADARIAELLQALLRLVRQLLDDLDGPDSGAPSSARTAVL